MLAQLHRACDLSRVSSTFIGSSLSPESSDVMNVSVITPQPAMPPTMEGGDITMLQEKIAMLSSGSDEPAPPMLTLAPPFLTPVPAILTLAPPLLTPVPAMLTPAPPACLLVIKPRSLCFVESDVVDDCCWVLMQDVAAGETLTVNTRTPCRLITYQQGERCAM